MIYIFTALKCEGEPLRLFEKDDLKVIVTGVGKTNMAFALGRTFPEGSTRRSLVNDIVINIGCCCAKSLQGVYLINKITDQASSRDFYPDMLRVTGIKEAALITTDTLVTEPEEDVLYDMEASSFYETASRLLSPDRIITLKIVSDSGNTDGITTSYITSLVNDHIDQIGEVIAVLRSGMTEREDEADIELIYTMLHATEAMKVQLDELINYARLTDADINKLISEEINSICEDKELTKAQGKEVLKRVRDKLTS
ncbi:MAG: hypothetical protein IJ757_03820 [Clostridiales bacterium]|nr:hypothetical protein [Clostridiales bacterium]